MLYVIRKELLKTICKFISLLLGPDFYMLVYEFKKVVIKYSPKILDMGLNLFYNSRTFEINSQYEYNSNSELFKRYPKNIRVRP